MNSFYGLPGQRTNPNPTAEPILLHLPNTKINDFIQRQPISHSQQTQGVPMNTPFFVLPPPRPKLVFQKRKLADFGNNGLLIMELTPMSYFAGRELSSIILVSLNHFEENDAWAIWKHDNCLAVKGYYTDLKGVHFRGWPLEDLQTELLKVCEFKVQELVCEPIPTVQERIRQLQRRAEVANVRNYYEPHPDLLSFPTWPFPPMPSASMFFPPFPFPQIFFPQLLLPQIPLQQMPFLPVEVKQEEPMETESMPQNNTQQNNVHNSGQPLVAQSFQYSPTPPSNKSAAAADFDNIPPPSPQSPLPALKSETLNTLMQPIWGQLAAH